MTLKKLQTEADKLYRSIEEYHHQLDETYEAWLKLRNEILEAKANDAGIFIGQKRLIVKALNSHIDWRSYRSVGDTITIKGFHFHAHYTKGMPTMRGDENVILEEARGYPYLADIIRFTVPCEGIASAEFKSEAGQA